MTSIEELRNTEERYRLILENQNNLIYIINQKLKIEYINAPIFNQLLGYTREDFQKKDILFAVHPDDKTKALKTIKKGIKKGKGKVEIRIRDSKGNYHFHEISGKLFTDFDGLQKVLIISRDITEKKEYEFKLKQSEEVYRLITENANDLIGILNKDFIIEFVNEQPCLDLLGYKPNEVVGKNILSFVHPSDKESGLNSLLKAKIDKKGIIEIRTRHKNGNYLWFEVKGKVFIDDDNETKGIIVCRDINSRKRTEIELIKSEEKYRKLFNNVPFAIVLFDIGGKILDCNTSTKKITGYSKKELIGNNFKSYNFYVDLKSAKLEERQKKAIIGELPKIREVLLYRKDGSQFWARTQIEFIHLKNINFIQAIILDITESKKAEQDLKESEEKFRNIAEQSLMGINVIQDGIFKFINKRTAEVNGYTIDEIKSWKPNEFAKIIHPEDRDFVMEQASKKQAGDTEVVNHYSFRIIRKDGVIRWLEMFSKTINYEGRPADLVMTVDITERKKAEKQIIDIAKFPSENPNPVLRANKQNILYINKVGRNLLRVSEGDRIPALLRDDIIKALDEKTSRIKEVEVNGTIFSFNIAPIQQEEYLNIYGQDITEIKKSENALNIEKKFTEDIIYSSQDTIFVFDPETGKAIRWNKEFSEVSGYSKEEISSMKAPDSYYSEGDLKLSEEAIQKLKKKGKTTLEMSLITKNGKKIPYEYKATTLKEPGGKISIVSIGRDITERNLVEQKLIESEQKYRDAYNMANFYKDLFTHDMSNLLQIINSSAEIISFQLGDSEKSLFIENMTNLIKNQIDRGSKLISDVRTLTSLAEEDITTEKIKVTRFLENSIKFVGKAYSERSVLISPKSFDEKYFTTANDLLQDVFENILINGIKYNESEIVEIHINISKQMVEDRNYIRIEFIDNGIGVSDSKKDLIFQPGNREIKGTKGMGIGLSLVSKIMEIFGGKIWVEDKIKGDYSEGSKFIVLLPDLN